MIRPWNWLSRWLWPLDTVVMSTLNSPTATWVPLMVIDPVTVLVRPTAVLLWPNSVSLTRYPALEPEVTFQVPSTGAAATEAGPTVVVAWAGLEATVVLVGVDSESGGGPVPSMKWMKTNGPATTRATMATAPPINQRFQR